MSKLKRTVSFENGYDARDRNAGISGVTIRFVATGERAAIQFVLFTSWFPSSVDVDELHQRVPGHCPSKPYPADIGYHAREPQYESQSAQRSCEYLDGAACYYDGSGLRAQHFFDVLRDKGEEALWRALEDEYVARFVIGMPTTVDNANFGETIEALGKAFGIDK